MFLACTRLFPCIAQWELKLMLLCQHDKVPRLLRLLLFGLRILHKQAHLLNEVFISEAWTGS